MLRSHQRTASTHGATPNADPDISPASRPSRRQCYSPVAGRSMRTQRETTLQWGRRALLFQGRPHKGFWSLLRSWLRPHRGISQDKLPLHLGFFQFVHNARRRGKALLGALIAGLVA